MSDHYTEKVYLTYEEMDAIKDALEIALGEDYDPKRYNPLINKLINKFKWLLDDPDWISSDKDNWKRR